MAIQDLKNKLILLEIKGRAEMHGHSSQRSQGIDSFLKLNFRRKIK